MRMPSKTKNSAASMAVDPTVASNDQWANRPGLQGASVPTTAIHTQGCKLNQADSEVLARKFSEAGYLVVPWTAGADVMVLNTCTVTAEADAKARQALRAARRRNQSALIVATGCYAQRSPEQLSGLAGVSLVMGNTAKDQIVAQVTIALAEKMGLPESPTLNTPHSSIAALQLNPAAQISAAENQRATGRTRAMVKIQEGCDQVCAYCIVPKVRGRERSIPPVDVLGEINLRVEQGYQEVVLTGTQLGTYGFDLPAVSLVGLLRRILEETQVTRLRVSSLQAQEINDELLTVWENSRMCLHFHVPLQSGSDVILKAMRRRYDTAQFARTLSLIRHKFPDAGITTDLIAGFPGEGEREWQQSESFARMMEFSDMHIFPFSPRPGTSAAHFGETVPQAEIKRRATGMAELADAGFKEFRRGQLGRIRAVLWESQRETDRGVIWSGLTDNYIRVNTEAGLDTHWCLNNQVTGARLIRVVGDSVAVSIPS